MNSIWKRNCGLFLHGLVAMKYAYDRGARVATISDSPFNFTEVNLFRKIWAAQLGDGGHTWDPCFLPQQGAEKYPIWSSIIESRNLLFHASLAFLSSASSPCKLPFSVHLEGVILFLPIKKNDDFWFTPWLYDGDLPDVVNLKQATEPLGQVLWMVSEQCAVHLLVICVMHWTRGNLRNLSAKPLK